MVLAMTLLLTAKTASAIPLSNLLPGGSTSSISSGNLEFSNFDFNPGVPTGAAAKADPSLIDVVPTPFGAEFGLEFIGTNGTWSILTGVPGEKSTQTTTIKYDVTVLPPSQNLVSDNKLILFSAIALQIGSGVEVTGTVFDALNNQIATTTLTDLSGPLFLGQAVFASPQPLITVNTTVKLFTGGEGSSGGYIKVS